MATGDADELIEGLKEAVQEPAAGSDAAGSFTNRPLGDVLKAIEFLEAREPRRTLGIRSSIVRGNGFQS